MIYHHTYHKCGTQSYRKTNHIDKGEYFIPPQVSPGYFYIIFKHDGLFILVSNSAFAKAETGSKLYSYSVF
ncbi:hypothetical protein DDD_2526 [Nonlabens dokdonensis DSW-6]|uniref:Uncharacterized protein n=1 Tax=Nonlabens dokdonensis (strain DSM 17205 / KCTC 12402 / DSW-6) TaxID=592029 RepID=L7WBP6_NONDD|nr:hypothetical protein DDD_2526 [Nonlabens dokdonensis DSW-6]